MDTNSLVTFEGKFCCDPRPGDMVRFYLDSRSSGIIVQKISEYQVEVLWSNIPNNPFASFRAQNYTQIAKQLFTVEPMPPGALPYYLDEVEKRVK